MLSQLLFKNTAILQFLYILFFFTCLSSTASFLLLLGHLSAQRVALLVRRNGKSSGPSVTSFIEELVVRRELTDNFCFYNKKYDSVDGQFHCKLNCIMLYKVSH